MQAYLLRGRELLALQAVKRGLALEGPSHPDVHLMTVQFCLAVQVRHACVLADCSPAQLQQHALCCLGMLLQVCACRFLHGHYRVP